MIVRMVWPLRPPSSASAGAPPMDAFWLECRAAEVDERLLARVSPERRAALASDVADIVKRARAQVARFERERAEEGDDAEFPAEAEWRRYGGDADPWICFLVSRDGASIEAHPWNFPFAPLWNAYSPFRAIPEVTVGSLAELRAIELPPDLEKGS